MILRDQSWRTMINDFSGFEPSQESFRHTLKDQQFELSNFWALRRSGDLMSKQNGLEITVCDELPDHSSWGSERESDIPLDISGHHATFWEIFVEIHKNPEIEKIWLPDASWKEKGRTASDEEWELILDQVDLRAIAPVSGEMGDNRDFLAYLSLTIARWFPILTKGLRVIQSRVHIWEGGQSDFDLWIRQRILKWIPIELNKLVLWESCQLSVLTQIRFIMSKMTETLTSDHMKIKTEDQDSIVFHRGINLAECHVSSSFDDHHLLLGHSFGILDMSALNHPLSCVQNVPSTIVNRTHFLSCDSKHLQMKVIKRVKQSYESMNYS
jgi:hypothetical protein